MPQNDFVISDQDGSSFLSDITSALQALASFSAGTSAPTTTYPSQMWFDTAAGLMKLRNAANTAWVTVAAFNGTTWIPYRQGVALTEAATAPIAAGGTAGLLRADGSGASLSNVPGMPIGAMVDWSGAATDLPMGYLICDGATIGNVGSGATFAKATYQTLFNRIRFGWGNAGTEVWASGHTAKLPDLRHRTLIGANSASTPAGVNSSLSTREPGTSGGSQNVSLSLGNMPDHYHNVPIPIDGSGAGSVVKTFVYENKINIGTTSVVASGSVGSGSAFSVMNPNVAGLVIIRAE